MERTGVNGFRTVVLAGFVIIGLMSSCSKERKTLTPATDSLNIGYTVKGAWPHDVESFTEGLEINKGLLYESTGEHGKSWIGVVDIKTGKPDKKVVLEEKYFGEGITILNNKVYQLTYKTKIGFIYDLKTFKKIGSFEYSNGEGWGLTHNNEHIIMSDGTEKLTFLDTVSLKPVKTLEVRDEDGAVAEINELEYVDGFIYTNLWKTNLILKIDAQTGKVVGRIDLTPKADEIKLLNGNADVLNGIAWHPSTKSLIVTGKHWPLIYILQLKK